MVLFKFCLINLLLVMINLIWHVACMESRSLQTKRHSETDLLDIDLKPSSIVTGITENLTIHCPVDSHDLSTDYAFVSLLVMFRDLKSPEFNVLGVIVPDGKNNPIQGKGFSGHHLKGRLDKNEGGFLAIQIPNPDEKSQGQYKCQVSTKNSYSLFKGKSSKVVMVPKGRLTIELLATAFMKMKNDYAKTKESLNELEHFVDSKLDKSSWTIIQRRLIGKVNFNRDWKSYKNGFGYKENDFWLGNDKIHNLTKKGAELKVYLIYKGKFFFAHYTYFRVESESSGYRMTVSGFSRGSAGDSLSYHSGMMFSTYDRDNDKSSGRSCAKRGYGGFWYNDCDYVNLNGKWGNCDAGSVEWHKATGENSATYTEMRIKPK